MSTTHVNNKYFIFKLVAGLILFAARPSAALAPGDFAPDFELPTVSGNKVSLNSACSYNKPVVLAFFATWCDICLKEIDALRDLASKHDADVYLIGINPDIGKLKRFAEKNNIKFPILHDPRGKTIGGKYGLFRGALAIIPKAYIISPAKKVEFISESYDESKKNALDAKLAEVHAGKWDKDSKLTIFVTSSGNGWIKSCNCYRHSYGGLIKLIPFIKSQRALLPQSLFVDSGDFLPPSVSKPVADSIIKGLRLAGYDAIGVGDQDVSYAGFRAYGQPDTLPFLSSNMRVCQAGKCLAAGAADKIVEKNGIKLRLISYIPQDVFSLYPEDFIKTLDLKTLADTLIPGQKHDFLVLISHGGADYDKKIAMETKGIDLIIGGHSQTLDDKPIKIGETLIVQAGANFQNVGKLTMRFDPSKKLTGYQYEIIPLSNDMPDDPQITDILTNPNAKP